MNTMKLEPGLTIGLENLDRKEYQREYHRRWRMINAERHKAYKSEWADKNSQTVRSYRKKWNSLNRDKLNSHNRERLKTDISYALRVRLRRRLATAIKRGMAKKYGSAIELIGCDVSHLIAHIESKFLPGMNWSNRSEWHIDHIKPCAKFNLTNSDHQKECFHWSNLQPLWAKDNRLKGAK